MEKCKCGHEKTNHKAYAYGCLGVWSGVYIPCECQKYVPETLEEEECGYCGGTGEVACSSTNYMACPACSKGAVKEG